MKRFALITILACIATISFAKTYDATVEACEANTSCSKCVDRTKMYFTVDEASKSVTVSATKIDGSPFSEVMEKCLVRDADNWSCPSFWFDFEAKNGLLALLKKDPYKGESKYEVCHVKN
jgi:hypothetical protein